MTPINMHMNNKGDVSPMDMELLEKIVRQTDDIFFNEELRNMVFEKGVADFVTRCDIDISEFLKKTLHEHFPEIGFVSEEGETALGDNRDCWILDPVDGTTNFMYQVPFCAVSLGLCSAGEIVAGIIYMPYSNELFSAQKGKGAFLNGERIECGKKTALRDSLTIFEYNPYHKDECAIALEQAKRLYSSTLDLRTFGSSAAELAYIACGRADAFFARYLKPWDYAAGCVILSEAGGVVSDLGGNALDFKKPQSHIVAANPKIHAELLELLR